MDNRRVLKNRLSALKDCEPWEMWSWGDFIESIGIDRSSNWEDTVDRVCRLIGGDPEREKAADWVEVNGGLDEVSGKLDAYDAIDDERGYLMELRAEVAARLGVGLDGIAPVEAHARMLGELDKRLMPEGMEWPRFEDGEKVCFGDSVPIYGRSGEVSESEVCSMAFRSRQTDIGTCADFRICLNGGERIKRPKPQVLAADGLPIEVGETVWLADYEKADKGAMIGFGKWSEMKVLDNDRPYSVYDIEVKNAGGGIAGFCCAADLTHTPPDTQERIDDDATMPPREYYAKYIGHDVGLKDDAECTEAMVRHILNRQRELDAKTMGGE